MIKKCIKCLLDKEIVLFYKANTTKDGYRGTCIDCSKKYCIKYYKNKVKTTLSDDKKELRKIYHKDYYKNNKQKIVKNSKNYYNNNKEEITKKSKKKRNTKKYKRYVNLYNTKNKDKLRKNRSLYESNKKKNDPLYKLTTNIRTLISSSIRKTGFKKTSKTASILGCSFIEFKIHLESQFDNKMTWDNYGSYWQIDHIYPISKCFTEEEILKMNHYLNLRPLEALENNKKNNKII